MKRIDANQEAAMAQSFLDSHPASSRLGPGLRTSHGSTSRSWRKT
jgi:hypothetical protein